MSVQSEITRLADAKAAIKTAIEGKGVTVPDATLLDGMAALIDTIETGGGGTGEEDSVLNRTTTSYTNDRVTSLGEYALAYCSKLTSVSFANVQTVGNSAFRNCLLLTSVTLPKTNVLDNSALRSCEALASLDLPVCSHIAGYALYGCEALKALVLRYTAICYLANKNAFTYTPIAYGTGYIYVPDDLVDSYKAATNWSTYADQIKPLSEYAGG